MKLRLSNGLCASAGTLMIASACAAGKTIGDVLYAALLIVGVAAIILAHMIDPK